MAGANCPETPRQKMIGMMYLFLTVMLALNVSAELLNAFVLVDRSILQAKESVELKNEEMYYDFGAAYNLNPTRVGDHYHQAMEVKQQADSLVKFIQEIKELLVFTLAGEEATLDDYKGLENTIVVGQVLLSDPTGLRRSAELKQNINDYRDFLITIVKEDTAFVNRIKVILDTEDPPVQDGVQLSWEYKKFNYVPMAGTLAILSQIQADIRNMEADVVRRLYMRVDEDSFKFNRIEPLVIPNSNYVIQGDEYKADIMMAAYDDTDPPTVIVNGQKLDTRDGKGLLRLPANRIGPQNWSGTITIMGPDGTPRTEDVTGSFLVAQPSVVVSPTKMNVFYEGVDNPVEISAPGVPSENLRVTISNATYTRRGNEYIVKPNDQSAGRESIVTVATEINGRRQNLGSRPFRINRVPNPVAKVHGISGGTIARQILLAQMGIVADMENFDFDLSFRVTQFRVQTLQRGYMVDARSTSNMFTEEQKELIRGTTRGQNVFIDDIRAVGPDGRTRSLGSISLTID